MTDHHSVHTLSRSTSDQQQTILIVDDDDAHLQHISGFLRMSVYGIASFHEPTAALLAVREGIGIDLVITDYRMPDMNGLEFIKALKYLLPAVPVIMLTALGDIDTYFKAFKSGIFEYIHKPVNNDAFLRIVKSGLCKGKSGPVPAVRQGRSACPY